MKTPNLTCPVVALIRNTSTVLMILGLTVGSHAAVASVAPTAEQIQIQREANQMVTRWRERFPDASFSLLLTSDPKEADRLASRIARFGELESISEELLQLTEERTRLRAELEVVRKERASTRAEVEEWAERGRRLMDQMSGLQAEKHEMEESLKRERDRQNRLIADRARLQSDIQRYRQISERLAAALRNEEDESLAKNIETFTPPTRLVDPPPVAPSTSTPPSPSPPTEARSGVRDLRQLR